MKTLAVAAAASLMLVTTALAQKATVSLPANTFFKGQTASQVLGKESLLGAKVLDKDNKPVGTVEDLILSGSQLEGLIIGVDGKKVGVRIGALKMTTSEGKLTVVMPAATPDIMKAVPAYQRARAAAKK